MRLGALLLLAVVVHAEELVTARLAWESGVLGKTPPVDISLDADGAGQVDVGDGQVVKVRAKANEVRIDTDLDGDLEKERPDTTKGPRVSRNYSLLFRFPGEPDGVPVVLRFCRTTVSAKTTTLHYHVRSFRQGTVVLASRLRKVALADGDGDLRFDGKEDRLYIDLDGNNKLDDADVVAPGAPFRLGSRGFKARIADPRGGAVEFRSAPPPAVQPKPWSPDRAPSAGRTARPPSEPFDALRKRFKSEMELDWIERYGTVQEIARHDSDEVFAFLVKVARTDPEEYVRAEAAEQMGYLHFAKFLPRVRALAKSKDEYVRAAALEALHGLDDPDREKLYTRELFATDNTRVADACAKGLAYLATPTADATLLKAARKLATPSLRAEVYPYLSYLSEPPPVEIVLAAAKSEEASLRADGLRDLQRMGHPQARKLALAAAKSGVGYSDGQAVIEVLGAEGDKEAVAALLGIAADITSDRIREKLVEALSPLRGAEAVAAFTAGLKHDQAPVRALAARMLADLPDRKASAALAKRARKEKDEAALAAIVEALGDQGDPRTVPFLLKTARSRDETRKIPAIRALARIGMGDPKVRRFFLKMLDSKKWENRIYAIDAAAYTGGPAMVTKVASNLDHREWRVRLAAAEALGHIRIKACVGPLIRRLVPEKHKRVRDSIAEGLFRLTGQHFYDFADMWQRWWKAHEAGFEVPEQIPQRKVHKGGTVASFYGLPVGSGRVVFIIDESGSMDASGGAGQNRLQVAVNQTLAAVGRLKPTDRANLIFFESSVHMWKKDLVKMTGGARNALEKYALAREPTGGTNLYDALEKGLLLKDVDTVFLLSDGVPGSGKYVSTADILRATARLNQTRRIAIHCVAIGSDSELLKKLAAANGGRYVQR